MGLYGFTGDVSIVGEGNVRTVTVSDITATDDILYITVNSGSAVDESGDLANGCKSALFTLGEGMKQAGEAEETNPATGVSSGMALAALIAAGTAVFSRKRK